MRVASSRHHHKSSWASRAAFLIVSGWKLMRITILNFSLLDRLITNFSLVANSKRTPQPGSPADSPSILSAGVQIRKGFFLFFCLFFWQRSQTENETRKVTDMDKSNSSPFRDPFGDVVTLERQQIRRKREASSSFYVLFLKSSRLDVNRRHLNWPKRTRQQRKVKRRRSLFFYKEQFPFILSTEI